jgi:hypothetical protein
MKNKRRMGRGMDCRGELTTETIVRLVLIIAGIAIVLVILFLAFDFNSMSQTEICRLGVLSRATVGESAQPYVPLKCTTGKICLTEKTDCDEFAGEKDVLTITLPDNKPREAAKIIEETTANAMFDCWSMMGQGKLDLFGSYSPGRGLRPEENVCVICSRVALGQVSKEVFEEGVGKGNLNVHEYLRSNQVPGSSFTYLQMFTDRGVDSYPNIEEKVFDKAWEEGKDFGENLDASNSNKQIAFVFSQIKVKNLEETLGNLGGDALLISGSTFITPGIGKVARSLILTKAGLAVAAVAVVGGTALATYNVYQGKQLAAGYCGNFASTASGGEKGCSLVSVVPYTVENVNSICQQIEGKP